MPIAPAGAVRKQIKAGNTDPIYLIVGDDEVEKATLAAEFAEVVPEDLRAFNVQREYGGEAAPSTVVAAARTAPMMASRRVVLVLRAERLLVPKRESEAATRELDVLTTYVKSPAPTTTLVLVAAAPDRRRPLVKLLFERATLVECAGPEGEIEAERWIRARVGVERAQIDADAVRLLAARAGDEVTRLRADVERTLLYAKGKSRITADDVRQVVGPATAHDDWGVTNAIERGSAPDALRELSLALDAGAVPYMVLGQLAWFVRAKMPPARTAAAVEAVFRTDLDLKSSAGDPRVLLERLVVELCGSSRPTSAASSSRLSWR